jgi:flagellar export protein FliJ
MAKRFRFRLDTLLKVRTLRERAAMRRVAAQRAEIARLDLADRQTRDAIAAQHRTLLLHQQTTRVDPTTLQRGRAWIAHLRKTMVLRDIERGKLQQGLGELQDRLRQARTDKRIIEKLRERREQEHVRDQARREQAEAEDLARQLHAFDWL